MEKIEYYVGINPDDIQKFINFMSGLNCDDDVNLHITLMNSYDDPDGYFTFILKGTWESYNKFLNKEDNKKLSWIKSVNHYEEE